MMKSKLTRLPFAEFSGLTKTYTAKSKAGSGNRGRLLVTDEWEKLKFPRRLRGSFLSCANLDMKLYIASITGKKRMSPSPNHPDGQAVGLENVRYADAHLWHEGADRKRSNYFRSDTSRHLDPESIENEMIDFLGEDEAIDILRDAYTELLKMKVWLNRKQFDIWSEYHGLPSSEDIMIAIGGNKTSWKETIEKAGIVNQDLRNKDRVLMLGKHGALVATTVSKDEKSIIQARTQLRKLLDEFAKTDSTTDSSVFNKIKIELARSLNQIHRANFFYSAFLELINNKHPYALEVAVRLENSFPAIEPPQTGVVIGILDDLLCDEGNPDALAVMIRLAGSYNDYDTFFTNMLDTTTYEDDNPLHVPSELVPLAKIYPRAMKELLDRGQAAFLGREMHRELAILNEGKLSEEVYETLMRAASSGDLSAITLLKQRAGKNDAKALAALFGAGNNFNVREALIALTEPR